MAPGMAGGCRELESLGSTGKRYLGIYPGEARRGDHAPDLAGAKRPQAAYAGCSLPLPVYGEAALHHGEEDAQRHQGAGREGTGHADGPAVQRRIEMLEQIARVMNPLPPARTRKKPWLAFVL